MVRHPERVVAVAVAPGAGQVVLGTSSGATARLTFLHLRYIPVARQVFAGPEDLLLLVLFRFHRLWVPQAQTAVVAVEAVEAVVVAAIRPHHQEIMVRMAEMVVMVLSFS